MDAIQEANEEAAAAVTPSEFLQEAETLTRLKTTVVTSNKQEKQTQKEDDQYSLVTKMGDMSAGLQITYCYSLVLLLLLILLCMQQV